MLAMLKASDLLSLDEMQALRRRSDRRGFALILHAWALILGSMALFALWPNPLTFVFAVAVIGCRQLGLAILMHDAAHGLLFVNPKLNEWLTQWLCAWPVTTNLHAYRPYHLKHHRFTQQEQDPDLGLSAPFPITRNSLYRKFLRDMTGQTAYSRRKLQWRDAWGRDGLSGQERLARLGQKLGGPLLVNAIFFAALAAIGYWWLYPALWLLPLFTWYQLISRIRNIAEHAVVPDNDDPLRNTRTTLLDPLTRLLVAPYWVNYHLEHHLFLFVPCYRLPEAHRLMVKKGYGPKMELKRGYLQVLREAASATADSKRGGSGENMQFI
ncbi:MAG: fatty acid desaturase [Alphaproteobacteria bacterium]|nr:fatty acid desaturase [Alphaproteobacteria bacterium]